MERAYALPEGYRVVSVFSLSKRLFLLFNLLGPAVSLLSLLAFSWLAQTLRGGFNIWSPLARFSLFPAPFLLSAQLMGFTVIYIVLHEVLHYGVFRAFGIKTVLHLRTFKPRITIPDGAAYSKYVALAAILAPLVVLGAAGSLLLLLLPESCLYLALFLLSSNLGASVADIAQALWILKHPSNYIFGSEKQGMVLWGPG
jgi:hypothetical protein